MEKWSSEKKIESSRNEIVLDDLHKEMLDLFIKELKGDNEVYSNIDMLLNQHDEEICSQCGFIFCLHYEPLHFHHDGCPCCSFESKSLEEITKTLLDRHTIGETT